MLFIFSTSVLIRHMWQLKTVVFLHWCLICTVLLGSLLFVLCSPRCPRKTFLRHKKADGFTNKLFKGMKELILHPFFLFSYHFVSQNTELHNWPWNKEYLLEYWQQNQDCTIYFLIQIQLHLKDVEWNAGYSEQRSHHCYCYGNYQSNTKTKN